MTVEQKKRSRRTPHAMFGDQKASPEEVEAFRKRVAEKQAPEPPIAKLVVDNDTTSGLLSPTGESVSDDDMPRVLDTVRLTEVQKRILKRLSDKEQKSIAKAKLMSEIGARAWLAEMHKTDIPKTVAIATVFAGMERSRVNEGPFVNFIGAVASKWPEFKSKWLRDLRTIATALLQAKENEGKQVSADRNISGVHGFNDLAKYGMKKLRDANRPIPVVNQQPILFKTGSELSRIDTAAEEDQVSLTVLTQDQFAATLNAQVPYYKKQGENSVINISAPIEIVKYLYGMPSASLELPYLSGVTRIPTLTANGKIVQKPGYNKDAKVFYAEQRGLDIPLVPTNPTSEQLADAVELIKSIFADFPFDGQTREENMKNPPASMVNAIGLLIQPFARPAYADCTPATLITKPAVGTGASLLASVCQTILSGRTDVRPPFASGEDEIRKALYTAVKSQAPYLFYDNLTGNLDSPTLAALLTSTTFTDRELGRSTERTLPVVSGLILTGNNPTFTTELQRRLSLVRLDAQTANPKGRTEFKHPDLIKYVTDSRGEIIAAILTLIAAWVADGQNSPEDVPYIASYAGWRHTIGGILENAGFTTFQANRGEIEKLAAAGDEDPIEDLIKAWYEAATNPDLPNVTLSMVVGGDTGLIAITAANEITLPVRKNAQATDAYDYNPTEFGKFMTSYTDRYFAISDDLEVKLKKGSRTKNGYTWMLVPKSKSKPE